MPRRSISSGSSTSTASPRQNFAWLSSVTRTITLAEGMTVKDLADKLDVRVKDVLAKLLMKRMMMTINSTLDIETAKDIAREFAGILDQLVFR